jgi:hypothetical protein
MVGGGGTVARTWQWRWGGRADMMHEARWGFWQKSRNRAAVAWFRAAMRLQEVERGAVVSQPPLPC